MNDKVSKHPRTQQREQQEAARELARELGKAMRPKSWLLARIAWYSILTFISAASISGAVWAVASLVRWL